MTARAAQPTPQTVPGSAPTPARQPPRAVTIEPGAAEWNALIDHREQSPHAARFREQLALPTTTPLIVTGHQPTVFHPGIVAKYLAADAFARSVAGAVAWLVADQDTPDVFTLRRPVRRADGTLEVEHARLTEEPVFTSVAVASQQPITDVTPLAQPFDRVSAAFGAHADAPNLAVQAAEAVRDLLADLVTPAPLFYASRLHETDLFNTILDAIAADPHRCVTTYNDAAAAHPEAHLRALGARKTDPGDDPELPLWRLEPGQPRLPVFASQLAAIPRHHLAPRATLLDGIVRLAGADLFIHGTGGAIYARATDAWFRAWRPVEECDALAPAVTATATRTIDTGAPLTTRAEADHAVWAAHHARHTPRMLSDAEGAQRKAELVREIETAPRRSPQRAALFSQLNTLLSDARRAHEQELDALTTEAAAARARAAEHHIASDRTWPFPAYPAATLTELAETIRSRFEN